MLNIGMAEWNTIGIQWESKYRCVIHGIRGDTVIWKGNAYLVILVSWILANNYAQEFRMDIEPYRVFV